MHDATHPRRFSSPYKLSWVLLLLLLPGWREEAAQTPRTTLADPTIPDVAIQAWGFLPGDPGSNMIDSFGPADLFAPLAQRDALLGLAAWDHSLIGAFQFSARLIHLSAVVPMGLGPASARPAVIGVMRFSGSTPHVSLDQIAKALRMDQLERQGMNLNLKSAYGNFRLQYREIFSGRANSLGGGVGQAAAAAMYTTPRFGNSKMFDFSAAALMGTGSINQMLGSGFGTSVIGGNGPALHKQAAGPTVAIKLTF